MKATDMALSKAWRKRKQQIQCGRKCGENGSDKDDVVEIEINENDIDEEEYPMI